MKFYVYYEDGYYDCGGVGFAIFDSKHEAMDFINERHLASKHQNTAHYRLFAGREIKLKGIEVVTRLVEAD